MYKGVIFDFDYTLVDATDGIIMSYNETFKSLGYMIKSNEDILSTIGLYVTEGFVKLTGIEDQIKIDEFVNKFNIVAKEVMAINTIIFQGVLDFLRKACDKNIKIVIVSTKHSQRIISVLENNNMEDYFDFVIGGEEVKFQKPNPEGILKAIDMLHIDKDDLVYVGDHKNDALAAKNAGIDFIGIATGHTSKENLENLGEFHVCNTFDEFAKYIMSLG